MPKIQERHIREKRAGDFKDTQLNFTHGVASGDPYSDSVILWTRLAPSLASDTSNVTVSGYVPLYDHETDRYIKHSNHRVCLEWRITSDANLTRVVDDGIVYTTSEIDFTVKVMTAAMAQSIANISAG